MASLNLTADELLVEMLPAERLVAVTRWADDPEMSSVAGRVPRSAERLPRADLERLIALRPDLVVVSEYTDADFLHLLERSGLRHHRLQRPRLARRASAPRSSAWATPSARPTRRQQLVARMDRVLGELRPAARRQHRRPRVLYWADPHTAGAGTAFGALIEAAGGRERRRASSACRASCRSRASAPSPPTPTCSW